MFVDLFGGAGAIHKLGLFFEYGATLYVMRQFIYPGSTVGHQYTHIFSGGIPGPAHIRPNARLSGKFCRLLR